MKKNEEELVGQQVSCMEICIMHGAGLVRLKRRVDAKYPGGWVNQVSEPGWDVMER